MTAKECRDCGRLTYDPIYRNQYGAKAKQPYCRECYERRLNLRHRTCFESTAGDYRFDSHEGLSEMEEYQRAFLEYQYKMDNC